MINEYVWQLYMTSEGSEVTSFFEENLKAPLSQEYIDGIEKLQGGFCASNEIIEHTRHLLMQLSSILKDILQQNGEGSLIRGHAIEQDESAEGMETVLVEQLQADMEKPYTDKDGFLLFINNMADYTT